MWQRIKQNWKSIVGVISLLLLGGAIWLLTTNNPNVWPVRHIAQYRMLDWWWGIVGEPQPSDFGTLTGVITDLSGQPLPNATVLASWWDGTTYVARSEADGTYQLELPAGSYAPLVTAPSYDSSRLGGGWGRLFVSEGETVTADATLPPEPERTVEPGRDFALGRPMDVSCDAPIPTTAVEQQIHFQSGERMNHLSYYYTPTDLDTDEPLPVLLAVYPSRADQWRCASLPLADAGYAVITIGPPYALDLQADVDELERLIRFVREGAFPGADGERIAVLGGSYSGLHVQHLLQREPNVQAALLLGAPTDLFEIRRRMEAGTWSFPPEYRLNDAFLALGLPGRNPGIYWENSSLYHLPSELPPLAILHSRSDAVVPYQQSEILAQRLDTMGIDYELHFFDGADHYLLAEGGDEDALAMYEVALNFLDEHLK